MNRIWWKTEAKVARNTKRHIILNKNRLQSGKTKIIFYFNYRVKQD